MKKISVCLLAMLFSLAALAQSEKIHIQIKQDGKIVQPKDDVYSLDDSEFSFEVNAEYAAGFLVGATLDKYVYQSALGEADLEVMWFENTGMADDMFNPNQEIIISDEAPSYWFYSDAEEHRFDRDPQGTFEQWEGTRTINTFNNLAEYEMIPVAGFDSAIFVYFYIPIYDDEYNLIDREVIFHGELKFK